MDSAHLLDRARKLHEAGALVQAEPLYRQVLQSEPANGDVLERLGMLCLQGQRWDEALAYLQQAHCLRPLDTGILHKLGLVFQLCGRHEQAVAHFQQALHVQPELAEAHNDLGNSLAQQGKLSEAIQHYSETIRLKPDFGGAFLNLGNALQAQGKREEAAEAFRECLRRWPKHPGAHFNLGHALQNLGRLNEAAAHYHEALRLQPSYAAAHNNLGSTLLLRDEPEQAATHYQEAIRLQPHYVEPQYNLGNLNLERGQVSEAIRCYQRALAIQPAFAPAHNNLAEAFLMEGDSEKAQYHFREVLRLRPRSAPTLLSLATSGFYSAADPDVEQLRSWLNEPGLSLDFASQLHFTLGTLLERASAWDEAFAHFRQGNALRRTLYRQGGAAFDPIEHSQRIERLMAAFSADYFRQVHGFGLATDLPVFIVGMPRSGTTLVEQILSSHPGVLGAGELKDVGRIVTSLSARLPASEGYPAGIRNLDRPTVQDLAQAHVRRLNELGASARRVTDKGLENMLHLGVIATLFPGATVIHCRRDARDVCVSCFCQFFKGLHFAWDLEDLGHYYKDYERLMAHWTRVLPIRMMDVVYEELVADVDTMCRRLVAFCGLDWDERCLRFYENRRAVQTVSKLQVRQPLYASSVGRWRRYAAHLGPLLRVLGDPDPLATDPALPAP
jgi:tetratricopeptide (TPR) repeat protein